MRDEEFMKKEQVAGIDDVAFNVSFSNQSPGRFAEIDS